MPSNLGAITSLRSLLSSFPMPSTDVACNDGAVNDLAGHLFFSIVSMNPSMAKRTRKGKLETGDLCIVLHEVLHLDSERHIVVLSMTPSNLDKRGRSCAVEDASLIFRLNYLSTLELLSVRSWTVRDTAFPPSQKQKQQRAHGAFPKRQAGPEPPEQRA